MKFIHYIADEMFFYCGKCILEMKVKLFSQGDPGEPGANGEKVAYVLVVMMVLCDIFRYFADITSVKYH